jgi:hypothetical protein
MIIEFKDRKAKLAKQGVVFELGLVTLRCDIDNEFDIMTISKPDDSVDIKFDPNALGQKGSKIINGDIPGRKNVPHTTFFFSNGDVLVVEHKNTAEMHTIAQWVLQDERKVRYLVKDLACNQPVTPSNNTTPEHLHYETIVCTQRSNTEPAS